MTRSVLQSIALCIALALPLVSVADAAEFAFGIVAQPLMPATDDAVLRKALDESDAESLAFVTVFGIKPAGEPCSDKVYLRRKSLMDQAQNGVIVSLAATDWAKCPPESGKSSAIGRLNRLRDLYFFDDFSLGASRIPVIRQSTIAKFRGFAENARWQIGEVMFATVNLPANNNNYVVDAGRNSEFEDRLIANRDWLNRVFTFAQREKAVGVVLFCDSNPLASPRLSSGQRDGFAEMRKLVSMLAGKFRGKVLIVSGQTAARTPPSAIRWRGNIGELHAGADWMMVKVDAAVPALFSLETKVMQAAEVTR